MSVKCFHYYSLYTGGSTSLYLHLQHLALLMLELLSISLIVFVLHFFIFLKHFQNCVKMHLKYTQWKPGLDHLLNESKMLSVFFVACTLGRNSISALAPLQAVTHRTSTFRIFWFGVLGRGRIRAFWWPYWLILLTH